MPRAVSESARRTGVDQRMIAQASAGAGRGGSSRAGMTPFDLRGRRALVTGSSRGIGSALARGLVLAGCDVVVHGRDPDAVAGVRDQLGAAAAVAFDVTDAEAVAVGVAEAEAAVGSLDVLVNNAGMQHRAPLLEFPEETWRRVLDVDLTSAFLVGRAVAAGWSLAARARSSTCCRCSPSSRARDRPLRRQQGRPEDAHARHVRRMGHPRATGQRDRAGLRGDGPHPAARGGSVGFDTWVRDARRPGAGDGRRTWSERCCPGVTGGGFRERAGGVRRRRAVGGRVNSRGCRRERLRSAHRDSRSDTPPPRGRQLVNAERRSSGLKAVRHSRT